MGVENNERAQEDPLNNERWESLIAGGSNFIITGSL